MSSSSGSYMIKEKYFLFFLFNTEPKQARIILSNLTVGQILCLQELCKNLVNNIIPLTPKEIDQLTPYKRVIKVLSQGNLAFRRKVIKTRKVKVYKFLKIIQTKILTIIS